jgi:hypothetical protein
MAAMVRFLIPLILFTVASYITAQQVPPTIDAGPDGVLFEIGKVDHSRHDYKPTGWEGIHNIVLLLLEKQCLLDRKQHANCDISWICLKSETRHPMKD